MDVRGSKQIGHVLSDSPASMSAMVVAVASNTIIRGMEDDFLKSQSFSLVAKKRPPTFFCSANLGPSFSFLPSPDLPHVVVCHFSCCSSTRVVSKISLIHSHCCQVLLEAITADQEKEIRLEDTERMDVVIPGRNVRAFCSSLVCASKIGKDLYIEFDSTDGLILRALNDAKSAYALILLTHLIQIVFYSHLTETTLSLTNRFVSFKFSPQFFERCSTPTNGTFQRQQKRARRSSPSATTSYESQETQSDRFMCRVPLRALSCLVRNRKHELSLRIKSEYTTSSGRHEEEDDDEGTMNGGTLCLSFEIVWQASSLDQKGAVFAPADGPVLRVLHRIPVASIPNVSTAVSRREGSSEFQANPSVLLRLLDPLKRTAEAGTNYGHCLECLFILSASFSYYFCFASAMIFRADLNRIHASSFHQSSHRGNDISNSNNNAIFQANSDSLLKTETGISCDELRDFFFRSDREEDENMPGEINRYAILVFPIKEARAFLQFANSQLHDAGAEEGDVKVFFKWGGMPLVWQIQESLSPGASLEGITAPTWKAELILATLDHTMLGSTESFVAATSAPTTTATNG